jgi:hypothetical protein
MKRTTLTNVWMARLRIYADGTELNYWDDFDWDETMSIRDALLGIVHDVVHDILDTFNDHRLELTSDGDLVYYGDGEQQTLIPDTIANADFTFGYKQNSTTVKFLGDRIPIRPATRGGRGFPGINTMEICFEPQWA